MNGPFAAAADRARAVASFATGPLRRARALSLSSSHAGLAALLLANWIRIYAPGPATDWLFAIVMAVIGLSLLGRSVPAGGRATAVCFAALFACCVLALFLDPGVAALRNLFGFVFAIILFFHAYDKSSEWLNSERTAWIFLIAFVSLFPLYFTPVGINANVFGGILAYLLLFMGLLSFGVAGRDNGQGWRAAGFLVAIVVVSFIFGSRSAMLAALAAGGAYLLGGAFLRTSVGAAVGAAAIAAGVAAFTALFGLPQLYGVAANFDRFVQAQTGMSINTGRQGIWPAAIAGIREAPWLGHGLSASIGEVAVVPAPEEASLFAPVPMSCLSGTNPGLFGDCNALIELRGVLRDRETVLWSWDFGIAVEDWRGISVGGDPARVVGLDLTGMNLGGRLSPVLARLDDLVRLRLGNNRLEGPIPAALGALEKLEELALDGNRLSGAVPEALGDLAELRELGLANNRLAGPIPPAVGQLPALSRLRLSGNDFERPFPAALSRVAIHDLSDDRFCFASAGLEPPLFGDCSRLLAARDVLASAGGPAPNWRSDIPLKEWRGVSFVNGRATVIDLTGRGFAGIVPDAFGDLSRLEVLRLGRNQLAGAIPESLAKLGRLRVLDLEDNRLGGAVPAALGNMPALAVLRLGGNRFTVCPAPALPAVVHHDLDSALPCAGESGDSGGLAADAAALLAARDALAGNSTLNWRPDLPLTAWAGVTVGGAPPRVVGLTLSGAGLDGRIPPELAGLNRLTVLRLDGNRLRGSIPGALGNLGDLRELSLRDNDLTGAVPESPGRLASLRSLSLDGNRLSDPRSPNLCAVADGPRDPQFACPPSAADAAPGERPVTWSAAWAVLCPSSATGGGLLDDCTALLRARDRLAGAARLNWRADVPIQRWQGVSVAGDPARVTGLELRNAGLSGILPRELGALSALRVLSLDGNALRGAVPATFGDLHRLETLRLDRNRLTGRLPAQLGALSGLSMLRIGGNDFAGCPPPALRRVADSDTGGALCFPLPESAVELAGDADILLAARDALTGGAATLNWSRETPLDEWGGVAIAGAPRRVVALDLSNAGLEGRLPPELAALDGLVSLRLGGNRLSGAVPAALGSLARLTVLALDDNRLQGPIPAALGRLGNLSELSLRNNLLSGDVPAELESLAGLSVLRLGGNRLEGCPPPALRAVPARDSLCLPLAADRRALAVDAAVLLSVRDTLAGSASLNWSADVPVDAWRGVTVKGAPPRIAALDLSDAGLTGRIPEELARLDALAALRLDGNALAGPVPEALAAEGRLAELRIDSDALADSPPRDGARSAAPLFCRARSGAGGGLLADCAALLAMRDSLAGSATLNWSRALPLADWQGLATGGAPRRVTALALPRMGLNGALPPELGRLERLASLNLEDNQLAGAIPAELGTLEFLEELDLSNNRLSGAIPPLPGRDGLRRLDLGDNVFLRCPDPREDGRARGAGLSCAPADNADDGSPRNLAAAMPLRAVRGSLAADAALLVAARDTLAGRGAGALDWRLDAPVATWRGVSVGGAPPRVVALDLSRTGLEGRIPPELGGLTKLVTLRLDGNRLSGPMPPELGDLSDLRELALQDNALSGPVPWRLSRLRRLESLRLDGNRLSGRIPAELAGLDRLAVLRLDGNDLFGPAPPTGAAAAAGKETPQPARPDLFCRESPAQEETVFADCRVLLEARDALAGGADALDWSATRPVGAWRGVELGGAPTRVVALNLPRAGLTGNIPPELGGLDGLLSLRLEGNALAGGVPAELANLDRLRVLNLGGNRFSGCLPREVETLGGGSARVLGLPPCATPAGAGNGGSIAENIAQLVDPETIRTTYISAHNQFLQTWFQTGALGLAALVALCVSLVFNLRAPGGVLSIHRYAFACLVFVIVHSTFETFLFRVNMATLAWMLLGAGAAAAVRASARGKGAAPA